MIDINKNCARFVGSQAGAKDFHLCLTLIKNKIRRFTVAGTQVGKLGLAEGCLKLI